MDKQATNRIVTPLTPAAAALLLELAAELQSTDAMPRCQKYETDQNRAALDELLCAKLIRRLALSGYEPGFDIANAGIIAAAQVVRQKASAWKPGVPGQ